MNRNHGCSLATALALVVAIFSPNAFAQDTKKPNKISDGERQELVDGLAQLQREVVAAENAVAGKAELVALLPDVQVCAKALDWGLNFDGAMEAKILGTAREVLKVGLERAQQLQQGRAPWLTQSGKVIRGFRSRLDDSVQPYVINVPASWRGPQDEVKGERRPYPLFIECPHAGLVTELAVNNAGLHEGNGFADDESLHLRAYARGYNAAKFAGEVNLFEQLAHAQSQYPVDDRRIVLHGFSMGGSCSWHLAAHHPDRWVAASPGAGFADTEHYVKIWEWQKQPPPWQFTLFHYYNATDVAGNIAMVPTFSYVGEKDGIAFRTTPWPLRVCAMPCRCAGCSARTRDTTTRRPRAPKSKRGCAPLSPLVVRHRTTKCATRLTACATTAASGCALTGSMNTGNAPTSTRASSRRSSSASTPQT